MRILKQDDTVAETSKFYICFGMEEGALATDILKQKGIKAARDGCSVIVPKKNSKQACKIMQKNAVNYIPVS